MVSRRPVPFIATVVATMFFLAVGVGTAGAADWDSLLADRLDASVSYREAILARRSAEVQSGVRERPFLPYLEIGTAGEGIRLEDGELQPLRFRSTLALTRLLGTTVELGVPLIVHESQETFGPVSLHVTRQLFNEDGGGTAATQAALLRARAAERSAYLDVKLGLAGEILDAHYSIRLLEANRENLRVLERVRTLVVDPRDEREVSRRILRMERGILQAEFRLNDLDARIRAESGDLYRQVMERSEVWLGDLPDREFPVMTSPAYRAQELELAAAQYNADRWFVPYVPNPTFRAGLEYDLQEETFRWSLSMQFNATILDRGERTVESMRRRERVEIERLRLQRLEDNLDRQIADIRHRLRILEIDRRLQVLEVEDERQNAAQVRALFEAGFETEENLIVAETDLSMEELALARIEQDYILQRLELLRHAPGQ